MRQRVLSLAAFTGREQTDGIRQTGHRRNDMPIAKAALTALPLQSPWAGSGDGVDELPERRRGARWLALGGGSWSRPDADCLGTLVQHSHILRSRGDLFFSRPDSSSGYVEYRRIDREHGRCVLDGITNHKMQPCPDRKRWQSDLLGCKSSGLDH